MKPQTLPGGTPPRPTRAAVWAAAIVAATFVAYVPALRSGYIWDDESYVHENRHVQGGWEGLHAIWWPLPELLTPQYYPLVFTSFWVEDKLWGIENPGGFHAVNVLLHALNALLVWRLAARLGAPWPAFIGALFALHPVHVESVAWITERKNTMSGLFYLAAALAYLNFDRTGRWRMYAACVACFVAALLSKTVTATLPAALLLMLFYRRGLRRRDACCVGPLLLLGAAFGLMTAFLEATHVGASGRDWNYSLAVRASIIAPQAFLFYAKKLLWPHPLIFVYPRWEPHANDWWEYLPLAVVLALFAATFVLALRRRLSWAPFLLLAFSAGTLFPALGFLNVYPHRFSFVADHFNYLGSLGFLVLFVAAAAIILRRFSAIVQRGIGGGVLAVLAAVAFYQCFDYRDIITLWERTLARNPHAWMAQVNLGQEFRVRASAAVAAARQAAAAGRAEEADRHKAAAADFERRAIELFERAKGYGPSRGAAWAKLGLMAYDRDDHVSAAAHFEEALRALPEDDRELWMYLSTYGAVLKDAGRLDEARRALDRAISLAEQAPEPRFNLAKLHVTRGDLRAAAEAAMQAARLGERNPEFAAFAGDVLMQDGRLPEAAEHYQMALRASETYLPALRGLAEARVRAGDCRGALDAVQRGLRSAPQDPLLTFQLIWVRAACPDAALRNGAEGVRLAEQVIEQVGRSADTMDALAAALAESGDFERAKYWCREALTAARQMGDARIIAEIGERLALYEAGKGYRLPRGE